MVRESSHPSSHSRNLAKPLPLGNEDGDLELFPRVLRSGSESHAMELLLELDKSLSGAPATVESSGQVVGAVRSKVHSFLHGEGYERPSKQPLARPVLPSISPGPVYQGPWTTEQNSPAATLMAPPPSIEFPVTSSRPPQNPPQASANFLPSSPRRPATNEGDPSLRRVAEGKSGPSQKRSNRKNGGNHGAGTGSQRRSRSTASVVNWGSLGITLLRAGQDTAGIAYDFPCAASEKHVCACQVECKAPGCGNAAKLCSTISGCKYVSLSSDQAWATLKRVPTAHELALLNIEGKDMGWDEVEAIKKKHEAEHRASKAGSTMRGNFVDVSQAVLSDAQQMPDSPLCGTHQSEPTQAAMDRILDSKLGIIALTMRTPATLQNSMSTWKQSGLLDIVNEKIALLNKPLPIGEPHTKEFTVPAPIMPTLTFPFRLSDRHSAWV